MLTTKLALVAASWSAHSLSRRCARAGPRRRARSTRNTNIKNTASLQRGARKYFVNYCLGCHSAKYVRYNRLGAGPGAHRAAGRRESDVHGRASVRHDGDRDAAGRCEALVRHARRRICRLIARSRGTDYLYTFLRVFYLDPSRPTGVNNLVLPGTAMPHVLWELQGYRSARSSRATPKHARRRNVRGVRTRPAGQHDAGGVRPRSCATS